MKKSKIIFLIFFLLIILIYTVNIDNIPDSIILFEDEELNIQTILGIEIDKNEKTYEVIQTSTEINSENVKKSSASVKLFDILKIKNIEINTIPKTTIIPLGNTVGLKLYTNGVLVVGKSQINGKEPYKNSGIEEGDVIVEINKNEIACTADLIKLVSNSNGEDLEIKYIRNGEEYNTQIEPVKTSGDEYKIGLWVRDGAAGIGTITYYEPYSKKFAALGHGILDIDTEKLITISSGEVVTTTVSSVVKGEKNSPGELKGSIINEKNIGKIGLNTDFGIYGILENTNLLNINTSNEIEVASRNEIKKGNAKILLTVDNNTREEYDIEIKKIYINNNENNKSMLIKITDEDLIEKTGGIVQRDEPERL